MQTRKLVIFLVEAIVIGLAVAFVLMFFLRPEPLERRPVVELKESTAPANPARPALPGSADDFGAVSYSRAVEIAAPAVVNIYTTKTVAQRPLPFMEDPALRRFFGDNLPPPGKRQENSLGSGVIISPQGYILTNNHVVANADEIKVALRDGRSTAATVVGNDPDTDLSVLKITLDKLPSITINQADSPRVGDVTLAIGNPFGVGQTVTMGIVSAIGRNELGINTFENFIQTDAAINPGNSGGALINAYGQLIGINTAIFSRSGGSEGVGFAIPVSIAKNVMEQIIEHGRTIRGWLGIEAQDLTSELAESFGTKTTSGVVVAGVLRGGPADKHGVKAGDVITYVNEEPVRNSAQLVNSIAKIKPGTEARLRGLRSGKELNLSVRVGERPAPPERAAPR